MTKALTVSVIICAYTEDRWDDLIAAVASVQQQTLSAKEIIVVIDHNPQLLQRVQKQFSGIHIIENYGTRGLSGARNSGIAVATGSIIAFMDEDATADVDWLAHLIAGYHNQQVLGVGGAIIPKWAVGRPRWFPAEFDWVVGCTYKGMPETSAPVRNLIGCNMSFRRHVFAAVGGFRVGIGRVGKLPFGCEETELCIRVSQRMPESLLLFEPRARVRHSVPASRSTWRYFSARCYAEGKSKSQVARFVGVKDGLASEQKYTLHTLPAGVLGGLIDSFRYGSTAGLAYAGAIVLGLLITIAGYVVASGGERMQFAKQSLLEN